MLIYIEPYEISTKFAMVIIRFEVTLFMFFSISGTAYNSFGDVQSYLWGIVYTFSDIVTYALSIHGVIAIKQPLENLDSPIEQGQLVFHFL